MDNNTLPAQDDMLESGPGNQELLDAVLADNSAFGALLGRSLPEEDADPEMVSEEFSDNEDPVYEESEDEAVSDEDVEDYYDDELDEDADDDATQETDAFELEDLDMGAHVNVKVDGETMPVSFEELIKGYQSSAHLSNQGRELGEARKAFKEEQEAKRAEMETQSKMSAAIVMGAENAKAKQYHEENAKLKQMKEDGADRYDLSEQRELLQELAEEHKSLKERREQLVGQFEKQEADAKEAKWQEDMDNFQKVIPEMIPEWSETHAMEIRDFALEEGIPEELLAGISNPVVVKVLSDFMKLKKATTKGTAKRKAPKAKGLPLRRSNTTPARKQKQQLRSRALSTEASIDDQMSFLTDLSRDLFKK